MPPVQLAQLSRRNDRIGCSGSVCIASRDEKRKSLSEKDVMFVRRVAGHHQWSSFGIISPLHAIPRDKGEALRDHRRRRDIWEETSVPDSSRPRIALVSSASLFNVCTTRSTGSLSSARGGLFSPWRLLDQFSDRTRVLRRSKIAALCRDIPMLCIKAVVLLVDG